MTPDEPLSDVKKIYRHHPCGLQLVDIYGAVLSQSAALSLGGTITLWSFPPPGYKVLWRCVEAFLSSPGAWLICASSSPSGLASPDLYMLSAGPPAPINKGYICVRLHRVHIHSLCLSTTTHIPLLHWCTQEKYQQLVVFNICLLVSRIPPPPFF